MAAASKNIYTIFTFPYSNAIRVWYEESDLCICCDSNGEGQFEYGFFFGGRKFWLGRRHRRPETMREITKLILFINICISIKVCSFGTHSLI